MDNTDASAIDISLLPDISRPEMTFYETAFFRSAASTSPVRQLPTPAAGRREAHIRGLRTVKFEELNLVVKFGDSSRVRLEEAQAMRAISQPFPDNEVPVPELSGWRVDDGQNFIYMSLIRGPTLRESWPLLARVEKESIYDQLSGMVAALRRIQQHSPDPFIGAIFPGHLAFVRALNLA